MRGLSISIVAALSLLSLPLRADPAPGEAEPAARPPETAKSAPRQTAPTRRRAQAAPGTMRDGVDLSSTGQIQSAPPLRTAPVASTRPVAEPKPAEVRVQASYADVAPQEPSAAPVSGVVDELARRQMQRKQPDVDKCLTKTRAAAAPGAPQRAPSLELDVADGRVASLAVSGSAPSAELVECLTTQAKAWRFALARVHISWPLATR